MAIANIINNEQKKVIKIFLKVGGPLFIIFR